MASKSKINVRPPKEVATTPRQLDRVDRTILRLLQRDASVSNVALAAKVHLSPAACLRRVERLKALGLVQRIVALLNPAPLNLGMMVVIGVVLDRSTPQSFADFEKAVQKVPGCLECVVVTGEFDYFVTVRTQDNESFEPPACGGTALPPRGAADSHVRRVEAGAFDDRASDRVV